MKSRTPYNIAPRPKYSSEYSLCFRRTAKNRQLTAPAATISTPKSIRARSSAENSAMGSAFILNSGCSQPLPSTLSRRLRIQNHFAELLAFFQAFMRRRGFTQGKALVHDRFDLAGENMLHHLVKIAHRSHKRSQERKLARKQKPDVKTGFRTRRGAAGHQLSSRLERLHALLPCGFAHVLKYDVAHLPVRDFLYLIANLLLVMVDYVVGAEFAALVKLIFVARGGDTCCAKHLADLDGNAPNPRAAAQHQHGIRRLDAASAHQHVPCRERNQRHGRGFIVGQFLRNRQDAHARHGDVFAVAAIVQIAKHTELRAEILLTLGAFGADPAERHGR